MLTSRMRLRRGFPSPGRNVSPARRLVAIYSGPWARDCTQRHLQPVIDSHASTWFFPSPASVLVKLSERPSSPDSLPTDRPPTTRSLFSLLGLYRTPPMPEQYNTLGLFGGDTPPERLLAISAIVPCRQIGMSHLPVVMPQCES